MSISTIKNGQRIKCNGVYGTVVGNRRTRNRRLVLVQMDNGFTLKLDARTLSVGFTGDVTDFAPDAVGPDASVFAKTAALQYFTPIHRVSCSMSNLAAGGRLTPDQKVA